MGDGVIVLLTLATSFVVALLVAAGAAYHDGRDGMDAVLAIPLAAVMGGTLGCLAGYAVGWSLTTARVVLTPEPVVLTVSECPEVGP